MFPLYLNLKYQTVDEPLTSNLPLTPSHYIRVHRKADLYSNAPLSFLVTLIFLLCSIPSQKDAPFLPVYLVLLGSFHFWC